MRIATAAGIAAATALAAALFWGYVESNKADRLADSLADTENARDMALESVNTYRRARQALEAALVKRNQAMHQIREDLRAEKQAIKEIRDELTEAERACAIAPIPDPYIRLLHQRATDTTERPDLPGPEPDGENPGPDPAAGR